MHSFALLASSTRWRAVVAAAALVAATFAGVGPASAATLRLQVDRFRVAYEAPRDPAYRALYDELRAARVLEQFRELLSFIRLPRVLTLRLAGCDGVDNAWYEPEDLTVTVCYEYLQAVRKVAPALVTADGVTPEGAVRGPLLEVFLHEVAHALFDQLRIPILGREEDAADQLAAFILLHSSERTARDLVLGVAWMYGQEAKGATVGKGALADAHGLAGQRFYNLLCMAYGAEPRLFSDLIEKKYLPETRAEGCEDEYRQVAYAVGRLMSPYIDASRREKVLAREWAGGRLRRNTAADAAPR